tara:strand:- start:171 stop:1148 length:978 start_codon:yes stop_codon:yes gene_type:complete
MSKIFSFSNERILIAGVNGMVGSAVKRAFLNLKNKEEVDFQILTPSRQELDYSNFNKVLEWFEEFKPTIVIVAAAKVGGIYANKSNPKDFLLDNLRIQNNLIEISHIKGIKRLLFLGSSCIYPKNVDQPIKEEYLLSGELEKTNESYAIAKIAGIKLCEAFRKQCDFDAICLMPTNLYGPGDNYNLQNSHVLPALIRKFYEAKENNLKSVTCWGTGEPRREFLHVDDIADACIFALLKFNPPIFNDLIYLNVGTGKDITIKELALKIATLTKYDGEIIWDKKMPNGTMLKKLDISRLTRLGWTSNISLSEGIAQVVGDFTKENKR